MNNMIRNIVIINVLLFFSLSVFCQDSLVIKLTKMTDGSKPNNINYILNENEVNISKFKIPNGFQNYRIFKFVLQKDQYLYAKKVFRPKEMTKGNWENFQYIDTTKLCRKVLRNTAVFLVEVQGGKKTIIYDVNENSDFRDDRKIVIDLTFPFALKNYKDNIVGNEISIDYEFFDGKVVRKVTAFFEVEPRVIGTSSTINPEHYIALKNNEYFTGNFMWGGKKYFTFLTPREWELGRYNKYYIALTNDSTSIDYKSTFSEDVIRLDSFSYKQKINELNNTITFVKMKKSLNKKIIAAPLFAKQSLTGETISLKTLQNKYVILDFWGTWCGPCVKSLPQVSILYNGYDHKFEVIGIAYDSDVEKVKNFLKYKRYKWPNIFESRNDERPQNIVRQYNITEFPTYILIDKKGNIMIQTTDIEELNLFIVLNLKND